MPEPLPGDLQGLSLALSAWACRLWPTPQRCTRRAVGRPGPTFWGPFCGVRWGLGSLHLRLSSVWLGRGQSQLAGEDSDMLLVQLLVVLLLVVVLVVVLLVGDGGDTLYAEYRSGKCGFVVIVWCCSCCTCTGCNCDNGCCCCCCGCRFARARRGRVVMMNVGQRRNKYSRRRRNSAAAAGPVYILTGYPVRGQGGEDGITVICGQASRAFCTTRMAGGEVFFIDSPSDSADQLATVPDSLPILG